MLKYNGVEYYYITNLQGDVVSIVDPTTGVPAATYEYDPFGKIVSATGDLATINPLRYRGYYYDSETGFYYLQSRYYDPTICRFINADSFASTGQGVLGYNMFAYCLNNPISMVDDDGYFGIWTLCGIGALVGGFINYAGQVIENYNDGKTGAEAWTDVNIGEIAGAAFSGAISAIPGSSAWGDVVDAIGSNVIEHGVNSLVYGDTFDCKALGQDIVTDYVTSAFLGDLLPTNGVPKYIRDIKEEAHNFGVKGTRKLQKYLNLTQVSTIVINGFNSDTSDRIYSILGVG